MLGYYVTIDMSWSCQQVWHHVFLFVNKTYGGHWPDPFWILIYKGSSVLYLFDGYHESKGGWGETCGVFCKTSHDKVYWQLIIYIFSVWCWMIFGKSLKISTLVGLSLATLDTFDPKSIGISIVKVMVSFWKFQYMYCIRNKLTVYIPT